MLGVLPNCWALFLGMGLIMHGNGLQATLVGVRATMGGFGTTITGLIMSGYFLGLITGCNMVPKMVGRVGHFRTFGAPGIPCFDFNSGTSRFCCDGNESVECISQP